MPKDVFRGEVRGFRERTEQSGSTQQGSRAPDIIWSFRVERYQDGNRLPPIPVEMRGHKFKGFINEGDTVEVYGLWREGETVRPKQIFNVTNNATVSVEQLFLGLYGTLAIIFFVIPMFVIILIVFGGMFFWVLSWFR